MAMERLYLAGPMSGIADHNFPLFHRAAVRLRERGFQVFDPADNADGGMRRSRAFYMKLDIPALLKSDAVVVLPGWERSRGASLEVWLALDMGMPIFRYEEAGEGVNLERIEGLDLRGLPFDDAYARVIAAQS